MSNMKTHQYYVRLYPFDDGAAYIEVDKTSPRRNRASIVKNANAPWMRANATSNLYERLRRGEMESDPIVLVENLSKNDAKDARKMFIDYFKARGREIVNGQ